MPDVSVAKIADDLAWRAASEGTVFDHQHAVHGHVRHTGGVAVRCLEGGCIGQWSPG